MTYQQRQARKVIERAVAAKLVLAKKHGVTESCIVWMGGRSFVICLGNGQQIYDYA